MRKDIFVSEEYYHIYNRGVEKRNIFLNDADRWRFLTLLLVLQGKTTIPQIGRTVSLVKHLVFDKTSFTEEYEILKDALVNRTIKLVCFCLMPNHFHLILQQIEDAGISNFMQRLGDAYTKYFNIKYERSGHLFGGVFQSRLIDQNEYLTYISAYIHLNPRELKKWCKKEYQYPWSSFQDYDMQNRWGAFLETSVIMNQFQKGEYQKFVTKSDIKNTVEDEYFIDS